MKNKLQTIIDKHSLLSEQLADPEIFNDQKKLTTTAKEHSALEDVVNVGKAVSYTHLTLPTSR